jgi:malonyl-ACP decarboxylase
MTGPAITGCGVIGPGAVRGMAAFAAFLRAGRSALRPLAEGEWEGLPAGTPAAPLDGFDTEAALAALPARVRRSARGSGRAVVAALAAAAEALAQAAPAAVQEFGVVVAGSNLGAARGLAASRKFLEAPEWTPPRHAHEMFDTHLAALAGEAFGLRGPALSVGGASASGNTALAVAADLVALGRMPGCLVLAPPPELSPVEWQALATVGALARPGTPSRPFDPASTGLAPGEVAAAVVIEAQAAAGRSLATIAGHAQAQQGRSGTAPDADTALRVMRAALAAAGVAPRELGLVAAHATGTPAGDAAEAAALAALLDGAPVPVTAPKALLGHAIQGAALVATLACVAQLRGGFVHGTGAQATRGLAHPAALNPAFGFGGIATALVLRAGMEG